MAFSNSQPLTCGSARCDFITHDATKLAEHQQQSSDGGCWGCPDSKCGKVFCNKKAVADHVLTCNGFKEYNKDRKYGKTFNKRWWPASRLRASTLKKKPVWNSGKKTSGTVGKSGELRQFRSKSTTPQDKRKAQEFDPNQDSDAIIDQKEDGISGTEVEEADIPKTVFPLTTRSRSVQSRSTEALGDELFTEVTATKTSQAEGGDNVETKRREKSATQDTKEGQDTIGVSQPKRKILPLRHSRQGRPSASNTTTTAITGGYKAVDEDKNKQESEPLSREQRSAGEQQGAQDPHTTPATPKNRRPAGKGIQQEKRDKERYKLIMSSRRATSRQKNNDKQKPNKEEEAQARNETEFFNSLEAMHTRKVRRVSSMYGGVDDFSKTRYACSSCARTFTSLIGAQCHRLSHVAESPVKVITLPPGFCYEEDPIL